MLFKLQLNICNNIHRWTGGKTQKNSTFFFLQESWVLVQNKQGILLLFIHRFASALVPLTPSTQCTWCIGKHTLLYPGDTRNCSSLMLAVDKHTCTRYPRQTPLHTQMAPKASSCSLSGWSGWRSVSAKYRQICCPSGWLLDPLGSIGSHIETQTQTQNWSQSAPEPMVSVAAGLNLLNPPAATLWHWSLQYLIQTYSHLDTRLPSPLCCLLLVLLGHH